MKRFLICTILALPLFTACSVTDYKQLEMMSCEVRSVENITYGKGCVSADINLALSVNNPTKSDFALKSLTGTAFSAKGSKVADATMLESVTLEPKCDTVLPVRLYATLYNPTAVLLGAKLDPESMTADFDLTVKSGPFSKRIQHDKMPLKDVLGNIKNAGSLLEKKGK